MKRRISFAMSSPTSMLALLCASFILVRPITFVGNISGTGSPNYMGGIREVHVAGNYAYTVSISDEAFNVLDVTDPASPILVANIRGNQSPHFISSPSAIDVAGGYAYVLSAGTNKSGITIFDISNPASPTVVGHLFNNYFSSANTIKVNGHYAYVIQGPNSWISVVDVSDPTNPIFINFLKLDPTSPRAFPFDIDISGNYAFVPGAENDTLYVIDISNPATLHVAARISGAGKPNFLDGCTGVRILGDYAFVTAAFDDSLTVIDVANPLSPKFVSHVAGEGFPNFLNGARHLHLSGNHAYVVAAEDSALTVVDISHPTAPKVVYSVQGMGSPNFLERPLDVHVSFNHAFVAAVGDHSLSVFKIKLELSIQDLMDEVENLFQEGTLDNGQYHSLMSKLDNAHKKLVQDKPYLAIKQLNNFINTLNSLIEKGDLSPEEGTLLIDVTNYIINTLR
jgi:hypothetical protein